MLHAFNSHQGCTSSSKQSCFVLQSAGQMSPCVKMLVQAQAGHLQHVPGNALLHRCQAQCSTTRHDMPTPCLQSFLLKNAKHASKCQVVTCETSAYTHVRLIMQAWREHQLLTCQNCAYDSCCLMLSMHFPLLDNSNHAVKFHAVTHQTSACSSPCWTAPSTQASVKGCMTVPP